MILRNTAIAAALTLIAAPAFASTMDATEKKRVVSKTTVMVKTIDADDQVSEMTIYTPDARKTAVLGAFAEQKTDAYIVEDTDGDLFINHLIPLSELPDPTLEVRVLDTFTTEYRGMTFTNKIVVEED